MKVGESFETKVLRAIIKSESRVLALESVLTEALSILISENSGGDQKEIQDHLRNRADSLYENIYLASLEKLENVDSESAARVLGETWGFAVDPTSEVDLEENQGC